MYVQVCVLKQKKVFFSNLWTKNSISSLDMVLVLDFLFFFLYFPPFPLLSFLDDILSLIFLKPLLSEKKINYLLIPTLQTWLKAKLVKIANVLQLKMCICVAELLISYHSTNCTFSSSKLLYNTVILSSVLQLWTETKPLASTAAEY